MKYYFQLQYRMIYRHLEELGIPPIIVYLLLSLLFTALSYALFQKLPAPAYLYILLASSFVLKLSEITRNEFLKTCFIEKDYYKLRLIENLLAILPFCLFLLYKMAFLPCLLLIVIAVILAFVQLKTSMNFVLPTPFYKHPFEFIVGFRTSFYLFLLPYYIAFFAYTSQNIGLGIFAIILLFLICCSYYTTTENEFYVWVHLHNAPQFLVYKIKIALFYASILVLPLVILLSVTHVSELGIIAGAVGLGYLYIIVFVLAKYANFPQQIDIVHSFLLMTSVILPPLLLFTIPIFYHQSKQRLQHILS